MSEVTHKISSEQFAAIKAAIRNEPGYEVENARKVCEILGLDFKEQLLTRQTHVLVIDDDINLRAAMKAAAALIAKR